MNLAQLQAAVITETNRPDLVAETLQAVLDATLQVHTVENFYKDLQESQLVFDVATNYLQTIDTTTIPFFRNMSYIRKSASVLTSYEQSNGLLPSSYTYPPTRFDFLTRIDIGNAIDIWGYEKVDVWYQAGRNINIKSSTPLQFALLGYHKYPNLDATGVNFSSWIADELPYVIVYQAAGSLFAKIGEQVSWATYMKPPIPGRGDSTGGLYYQRLAVLKQNNITPESY
jgi:hypothetical protein